MEPISLTVLADLVYVFIDFLKMELRPSSPLIVAAVGGAAALWIGLRPSSRRARWFLVAVVTAYWFLSTRAGSDLLGAGLGAGLRPIQTREDARGADIVVVLSGGGYVYREAGMQVGVPTRGTILRALEGARVFRAIGARQVVASGGRVHPDIDLQPESQMLRDFIIKAGVPAERVVEESESRTTAEQARFVARMLEREGTRQCVLVTSPTHMRRSMVVFRAEGVEPIPSPAPIASDQMPQPSWWMPNYEALYRSDVAIYDYAATFYYWLSSRSRPVR